MGYKAMVRAGVDAAFRLVGDLASDVTLVKKEVGSFDFASGAVKKAPQERVQARAVFMLGRKSTAEHNAKGFEIMLKKSDVEDVTVYDSVILDGQTWRFGPVVSDDGFVVTAEVFRET